MNKAKNKRKLGFQSYTSYPAYNAHGVKPVMGSKADDRPFEPGSYRFRGRKQRMGGRPMTYDEAEAIILPFGKHKGKDLGELADDDEGLLYLDWLRGQPWIRRDLKEGLDVVCDAEINSRRLDDLLD